MSKTNKIQILDRPKITPEQAQFLSEIGPSMNNIEKLFEMVKLKISFKIEPMDRDEKKEILTS